MAIVVRALRPGEELTFLDLHHRSVRGLAASHYPREVIEQWAAPVTEDLLQTFTANADGEIRLIAELDGRPAGIGALVVEASELRACYVVPEAARRGVGTVLVREIERLAREHGLGRLELVASVNAEPFYARLGYVTLGRTEHVLPGGRRMAAVKMARQME